jgi:hypothetical protein
MPRASLAAVALACLTTGALFAGIPSPTNQSGSAVFGSPAPAPAAAPDAVSAPTSVVPAPAPVPTSNGTLHATPAWGMPVAKIPAAVGSSAQGTVSAGGAVSPNVTATPRTVTAQGTASTRQHHRHRRHPAAKATPTAVPSQP